MCFGQIGTVVSKSATAEIAQESNQTTAIVKRGSAHHLKLCTVEFGGPYQFWPVSFLFVCFWRVWCLDAALDDFGIVACVRECILVICLA